ncbi:uncharacterized protein LOC133035666 [Cannabis sativa]|uniref:uncharacterized protein LOC133035666 n=1 Tax=Cannabis sativa TaxID=3483 RepID=UPI0029CAA7E1|nr:uncharacterized protein LOC133035666 [Cannabis sativa]
MSTLSWNCRGLGNPRARQFLENIVVQKKPNFLFLCETLCRKDTIERLRIKLGFEGAYCVDVQGHKGGIAMLWRYSDGVRLLGFSNSHIDIEVVSLNLTPWRLTGFYGEPNRSLRFKSWQLITTLSTESQLPWCIIGDINNVGNQNEKKGGRPYPSSLIEGFQHVLQSCDLVDMELKGHPYTWERGKGSENWVEIRLDKALVTHPWLDTFPNAVLTNGDVSSSDHTPIFLEPAPAISTVPVHLFRFENAWTREPICAQIFSILLGFEYASATSRKDQHMQQTSWRLGEKLNL